MLDCETGPRVETGERGATPEGPGAGHMSRDTHYVIDFGHHIRPCQANLTPSPASYNYPV